MTASSSKATIDKAGGKILLKFPKKEEGENSEREKRGPMSTLEENNHQRGGTATQSEGNKGDSPHGTEGSAPSPSWWKSMMMGLGGGTSSTRSEEHGKRKIPIPLVKYDEF